MIAMSTTIIAHSGWASARQGSVVGHSPAAVSISWEQSVVEYSVRFAVHRLTACVVLLFKSPIDATRHSPFQKMCSESALVALALLASDSENRFENLT
jgi:hypothetical protein